MIKNLTVLDNPFSPSLKDISFKNGLKYTDRKYTATHKQIGNLLSSGPDYRMGQLGLGPGALNKVLWISG